MSTARIPASIRRQVLAAAQGRCAYCQSEEWLMGVTFEIDHIVPRLLGGETSIENLCLCCPSCNRHKASRTHAVDPTTGAEAPLFHPTNNRWSEHFDWSDDGVRIVGLTPTARATIEALKMNRRQMLELRKYWSVNGDHPRKVEE